MASFVPGGKGLLSAFIILHASYYTIDSLKKEGTWARTHGLMANGELYKDDGLTAACNLLPLGSRVRVTSRNNRSVDVTITDRISKRFGKTRIDLSYEAMRRLDGCKQGLIPVEVTYVGTIL